MKIGLGTHNHSSILWITLLFMLSIEIALYPFISFEIDIFNIIKFIFKYILIVCFFMIAYYIQYKDKTSTIKIFEPLIVGLISSVAITVITFYSISLNFPTVDNQLIAVDEYLNFDWKSFIHFIDNSWFLSNLLFYSYISFHCQLVFIVIILGVLKNYVRAHRFVFCYMVVCIVASAISVFTPAYGTYLVYNLDVATLKNIDTSFVFGFSGPFDAVRRGAGYVLNSDQFVGILTFPSVHASVAGLCAWAFWGNRFLFYPFLILNICMAASAISHANHYFVDVVAGLIITAIVVQISALLFSTAQPYSKQEATAVRIPS